MSERSQHGRNFVHVEGNDTIVACSQSISMVDEVIQTTLFSVLATNL